MCNTIDSHNVPNVCTHTHTLAVLDFGAVGDGTTDNVQAFQNALNAAVAGGTGKTARCNSGASDLVAPSLISQ